MPYLEDKREYRYFQPLTPLLEENENSGYVVEGYASTWDPYVLFREDGIDYKEQIMPSAFAEANFEDCIFQYMHEGPVFARTRNKTLEINTDDKGLHIKADLSKTSKAKSMYEDIASGNVDRMSFAFIVSEDHYDSNTHTRYIDKIAKVFDVSAVSLPANPFTNVSATRSAFDGFIESEKQELLKREMINKQKQRIALRIKMLGIK